MSLTARRDERSAHFRHPAGAQSRRSVRFRRADSTIDRDRRQNLTELMSRGYEDAYRQFIEPVVGASGERVGQAESGMKKVKPGEHEPTSSIHAGPRRDPSATRCR